VDKGCEVPHDHDSVVIVTVPLLNDEFVDFKTVKLATETLLEKMMNKNITDLFALGTTEELVEYLAKHIGETLDKRIDVYIQETHKYGMEYVSD
jgi:6-pyruvoyl-tetrahydropterin synthase